MVKILLITFIFMIFGCSSSNDLTDDENQSQQLLKLISIKIVHNGAYSGDIGSDETPDMCKSFILEEFEIFNFFVTARSATLREYEHDLIASNCYVSGTFVSENGVRGTWKIDRSRRGFLHFSGSKSEYYYCGECENQLFYESCDINCIHGQ
jgi:hypothetical protein